MRWRRVLSILMSVLLWAVLVPLLAAAAVFVLAGLLVAGITLGVHSLVVHSWNSLPRNRRAIRRARAALELYLPGRLAREWHVARRDWQKCFVQATLTGATQPPTVWLCAVWDETGQVDDLGTWQFQHGVGVRHAARAYDRSRAAGRPWPMGITELVAQAPAGELPAAGRSGLYLHEGTVTIRLEGRIRFFTNAYDLRDALNPDEFARTEVYDAEGRPLKWDDGAVFMPFPPPRPDKVFIERLRHQLMSRTDDHTTRQRLQHMLPAELVDFGISHGGFDGDVGGPEDVELD